MQKVADYSIITDGPSDSQQMAAISWQMPANVDPVSRGILSFMLRITAPDKFVSLRILINGAEVWSKHVFEAPVYTHVQEVIPKGLLVPAKPNVINFIAQLDNALQNNIWVGDVVVFFQAIV